MRMNPYWQLLDPDEKQPHNKKVIASNERRFEIERGDQNEATSGNMSNRYSTSCSNLGFSLIELLVVIAIAGIILAIASPSYSNFINRENVDSLANEYLQTLSVVRSNAIKSGTPVFLCASSDNESCNGQWNEGWLAFKDEDRDNNLSVNDTVVLKRSFGSSTTQVSVTSVGANDVDMFSYNYRGTPNIAIEIEVTRGGQSKSISVTPFGRARRHE